MTATTPAPEITDGRIRRGRKTRESLINAAIESFGARGFAATSMKDLAAIAGVQASAIYNHFNSKEEVLAAALVWALEDFKSQVIASDDPDLSPAERLENLVRGHVSYQIEHAHLVRYTDALIESVALGELLAPADQETVKSLIRDYRDLLTGIVDDLPATGSAPRPATTMCVLAIVTLCDLAHSGYRVDAAPSLPDPGATYWSLVSGMLRLD